VHSQSRLGFIFTGGVFHFDALWNKFLRVEKLFIRSRFCAITKLPVNFHYVEINASIFVFRQGERALSARDSIRPVGNWIAMLNIG